MTNQQKIDAIFYWIYNNDMYYIRSYDHTRSDWVWQPTWVDDMCTRLMDDYGGNCFCYASYMGFLVKEATGLQVRVYHGMTPGASVPLTPHGWMTVNQDGTWYSYDIDLYKFSNFRLSYCYKLDYFANGEGSLYQEGVATNLY
jgi:hypothetical protein